MPKRFAITTGNWSDTSTWDSGNILGIPTSSDDVWTNGSTVNVNQSFIVNSLNNSGTTTNTTGMSAPMVTNCIIPNMTSFTTPEGLAFASNYQTNAEPWRAFDGTSTGIWASSTANSGSVGYQFTSPKNIKRYAWRAAPTVTALPSRWTFEGSNDNTTYTVLDTVTASLAAEAVYTSALLANTASFSYYRMNISAVNTLGTAINLRELEMTESTSSATGGASGGAYNFNTADVSASITSTITPISLVANNSITVTATTGTTNISAPFAAFVGFGASTTQLINHTGNCNLVITGSSFTAGTNSNAFCINKSSTGTITVIGNLIGLTAPGSPTSTAGLNSTAGNTVIIGNIAGSLIAIGGSNNSGLIQSAGSLTVIGNISGGVTVNTSYGINFSGTSLEITGSITGGSGTIPAAGINITGTPTINISGSVNGATAVGISSTTANTTNIIGNVIGSSAAAGISYTGASVLNITGSLIAGTGANAISSTSTSATTIVRGNLINTNGRMAFYGPKLQLASGSLTTWRFTSSTGTDRTLYTLDQIGDQPSPSNVRTGVSYAGGSLTGTMAVPPTASVALGVPVGNTTGSAVLNPTYVADEIWNQPTSTLTVSGSIGERIKNAATVQSTGAQIAALAGGN
jgi:hypothetical protein